MPAATSSCCSTNTATLPCRVRLRMLKPAQEVQGIGRPFLDPDPNAVAVDISDGSDRGVLLHSEEALDHGVGRRGGNRVLNARGQWQGSRCRPARPSSPPRTPAPRQGRAVAPERGDERRARWRHRPVRPLGAADVPRASTGLPRLIEARGVCRSGHDHLGCPRAALLHLVHAPCPRLDASRVSKCESLSPAFRPQALGAGALITGKQCPRFRD